MVSCNCLTEGRWHFPSDITRSGASGWNSAQCTISSDDFFIFIWDQNWDVATTWFVAKIRMGYRGGVWHFGVGKQCPFTLYSGSVPEDYMVDPSSFVASHKRKCCFQGRLSQGSGSVFFDCHICREPWLSLNPVINTPVDVVSLRLWSVTFSCPFWLCLSSFSSCPCVYWRTSVVGRVPLLIFFFFKI